MVKIWGQCTTHSSELGLHDTMTECRLPLQLATTVLAQVELLERILVLKHLQEKSPYQLRSKSTYNQISYEKASTYEFWHVNVHGRVCRPVTHCQYVDCKFHTSSVSTVHVLKPSNIWIYEFARGRTWEEQQHCEVRSYLFKCKHDIFRQFHIFKHAF